MTDLAAHDTPESERDTEICGDTYDHDIDPRAYEDSPEGPWECRRCYAEIWPEED